MVVVVSVPTRIMLDGVGPSSSQLPILEGFIYNLFSLLALVYIRGTMRINR